MEDTPAPPLVFANQVIEQLISHLFGDQLEGDPHDFTSIRLAYRSRNGSWEQLWHGNLEHMGLLKDIVSAWGKIQMEANNA